MTVASRSVPEATPYDRLPRERLLTLLKFTRKLLGLEAEGPGELDDKALAERLLDLLVDAELGTRAGLCTRVGTRTEVLAGRFQGIAVGIERLSRTLVERAIEMNAPLWGDDAGRDIAAPGESVASVGPYIALPLYRRSSSAEPDIPYGALLLLRDRDATPFDADDRGVAILAAQMIGPHFFHNRSQRARVQQREARHARLLVQSNRRLRLEGGVPLRAWCPLTAKLLEQVEVAAREPWPCLIYGAPGVGKEHISYWIHKLSSRHVMPYNAVNCAALHRDTIKSELFGHAKSAFTGADSARIGLFEDTRGGTIFVDELTEVPLDIQAALLRFFEEGAIRPVGGNEEISVDVKVVCATNRDPFQAVKDGTLREDMLTRFRDSVIYVPLLRERSSKELEALSTNLMQRFGAEFNLPAFATAHDCRALMTESAWDELVSYDWPGNVRSLEGVISKAILAAGRVDANIIDVTHLLKADEFRALKEGLRPRVGTATPSSPTAPSPAVVATTTEAPPTIPPRPVVREVLGRDVIVHALRRNGGNVTKTRSQLGVSHTYFYRLLAEHGINPSDFRKGSTDSN